MEALARPGASYTVPRAPSPLAHTMRSYQYMPSKSYAHLTQACTRPCQCRRTPWHAIRIVSLPLSHSHAGPARVLYVLMAFTPAVPAVAPMLLKDGISSSGRRLLVLSRASRMMVPSTVLMLMMPMTSAV